MKKKILCVIAAAALSFSSISAFAVAEKITLNNETVEIPADMGTIREVDERTFVPVRFVTEYLGCTVNYQETNDTYETSTGKIETLKSNVTFTDPATNTSYFFTVGDNKIFVITSSDARIVPMDTKSFLGDDDRTYVPIRFLAEAMNYTVGWEEASQTVSLTKN